MGADNSHRRRPAVPLSACQPGDFKGQSPLPSKLLRLDLTLTPADFCTASSSRSLWFAQDAGAGDAGSGGTDAGTASCPQVTVNPAKACANQDLTFTLTGAPAGLPITWTGGGTPAPTRNSGNGDAGTPAGTGDAGTGDAGTQAGPATFTTRFDNQTTTTQTHKVTASWAGDAGTGSASASVTVSPASGSQWVGQFPGSKSLDDLTPEFKAKLSSFLAALGPNHYQIIQTFRPQKRAYLTHFSYKVAHGLDPTQVPDFDPSEVADNDPYKGPIDICWLHRHADGTPDPDGSTEAAQAMVATYQIAYAPAYPTNHTGRDAVDMQISWTGNLQIRKAPDAQHPDGQMVTITSDPKNGGTLANPAGNADLNAVAATYGVYKLTVDWPHWSAGGN